ncbi:unnamed protein product [Parnassius apollo]|uniref:(apollo) hypothetical protein n=1 Tax=Parnassius apollo TaxID=110799 RepID=A0A8S3WI35_PARAO|nr:unnamed protein product [Parnassius apollo]
MFRQLRTSRSRLWSRQVSLRKKISKMKKGRSLKLLNMVTNVIQGPDSNTLNSTETEVEKSDDELIQLSQMQNENVRDSEVLLLETLFNMI